MKLSSLDAHATEGVLKALDESAGCFRGLVDFPDYGFVLGVEWDTDRDAHVAVSWAELK